MLNTVFHWCQNAPLYIDCHTRVSLNHIRRRDVFYVYLVINLLHLKFQHLWTWRSSNYWLVFQSNIQWKNIAGPPWKLLWQAARARRDRNENPNLQQCMNSAASLRVQEYADPSIPWGAIENGKVKRKFVRQIIHPCPKESIPELYILD